MTGHKTTNHTALKVHVIPYCPLSSHPFFSLQLRAKMALNSPTSIYNTKSIPSPSPLALTGNVGLRLPSDRFALKSSFYAPSLHLFLPPKLSSTPATAPKIWMRTASKQSYICRDCGYIYSDKTPFDKLPDKYFCPVCAAPKRRFRPYEPKVTKDANSMDVRKARKEQLKRDEAIGNALPIAIGVGVIAIAALYFYVNNSS